MEENKSHQRLLSSVFSGATSLCQESLAKQKASLSLSGQCNKHKQRGEQS